MARCYYEDARWPWRPDAFLRKHTKQRRQIPRLRSGQGKQRNSPPRALDLGMGYGRNALWLTEQGYEVEGWETDQRYRAEARREARQRGLQLHLRSGNFVRAHFCGPYDVIVISNALHQVRRSAALRVLRQARAALAPGGRLFLLVKLTRDLYFQRTKKDPNWAPVPGEKNTLQRLRAPRETKWWVRNRRRRCRRWVLSALTPAELGTALRGPRGKARGGLRILWYREVVLRSEWQEPEPVTHHLAEVVAEKPPLRKKTRGAR